MFSEILGLRLKITMMTTIMTIMTIMMIIIYRIVLLDGERLERKAQSYLVRKPQSESARCPFANFDEHMMAIHV